MMWDFGNEKGMKMKLTSKNHVHFSGSATQPWGRRGGSRWRQCQPSLSWWCSSLIQELICRDHQVVMISYIGSKYFAETTLVSFFVFFQIFYIHVLLRSAWMEPSWLPADDLSHDDDGALSTGKGHITGFGQKFSLSNWLYEAGLNCFSLIGVWEWWLHPFDVLIRRSSIFYHFFFLGTKSISRCGRRWGPGRHLLWS